METLEVRYEVLPANYPAQIFEELARLTGRKLTARDFSQSNLTTINVWLVLRDIYVFLKKVGEPFQYRETFSFPEYYTVEQTLRHLVEMLAQFRPEEEKEESIFDHLGHCEVCYQYFKVILNSFLEAVQGMDFEDRFVVRFRSLLGEIFKNYNALGLNLTMISPQQSMVLADLRREFGEEGVTNFLKQYVVPFLQGKQKTQLSLEEMMALVAKFRASRSTN